MAKLSKRSDAIVVPATFIHAEYREALIPRFGAGPGAPGVSPGYSWLFATDSDLGFVDLHTGVNYRSLDASNGTPDMLAKLIHGISGKGGLTDDEADAFDTDDYDGTQGGLHGIKTVDTATGDAVIRWTGFVRNKIQYLKENLATQPKLPNA